MQYGSFVAQIDGPLGKRLPPSLPIIKNYQVCHPMNSTPFKAITSQVEISHYTSGIEQVFGELSLASPEQQIRDYPSSPVISCPSFVSVPGFAGGGGGGRAPGGGGGRGRRRRRAGRRGGRAAGGGGPGGG